VQLSTPLLYPRVRPGFTPTCLFPSISPDFEIVNHNLLLEEIHPAQPALKQPSSFPTFALNRHSG